MTVSAALKAHLALDTTSMTTLWKVTRKDAVVYTFTEFSEAITYEGRVYQPSSGFQHSNISTTAAFNVDNLEVDSVLSSDTILEADLLAGVWDGAAVEIFQVNWADLSMGTLPLRSGTLGEVRTGRNSFNAELRGLTQPLQQTVGRLYSIACDANLGDARCTKSLAAFTASATVTSVTDQAHFAASGLAHAAGYFDYGKITFTSGANSGKSMEVKAHTAGGVLSLQMPMPYTVTVGDSISMVAGCDKSVATCQTRFANVVNFRGFPHIPGIDKLASGS